jgi:hypothetical protein
MGCFASLLDHSMDTSQLGPEADPTIERMLGYLNFSSGASDAQFLAGIDELYRQLADPDSPTRSRRSSKPHGPTPPPTWHRIVRALTDKLESLHRSSETFKNVEQASSALAVVEEHLIREYFEFHRDLLFHQNPNNLVGPFMLGRCFEAILATDMTPEAIQADPARASRDAITRLNDFIGHRPVAALESQKIEPRGHEWVRPVPLYVEGAGIAAGPYEELVQRALDLLRATDEDLLEAAFFSPDAINELAFDPRAYDFDHPANKRPNYHFGEWDPHVIDNKGRYRRFVVREVTLKAMLDRVGQAGKLRIPRDELMFEAGAVLAGTILMAAGVSGRGPDTHDSNTTLMTLIPRIATYRDAFYERLIDQLEGGHAQRLVTESQKLRQPFGGARQHLNTYLSRQRTLQIQHAKLAKVFARMGYLGAAQRQANAIQVASSRMTCRIDCAVTAARQALAMHDRETAMRQLERIVDLIHRGIDCGAIVDPWNILGFDANFSLFPALENTIHDRRIDDLIDIIGQLVDLFARLWSDAAAADDVDITQKVETQFENVAHWWNRFAAHEVSSVDAPSALLEYAAARDVAQALREWHRRGVISGDVAFWAPHVESFESPKAYALVVETLLGREDFVSSMSLLIHWLGKAPEVALESNESSFQSLATQWVHTVVRKALEQETDTDRDGHQDHTEEQVNVWQLLRKFFDYLEANANEYWEVPSYESHDGECSSTSDDVGGYDEEEEGEDEGEDDGLFRAAYEDVVFRDSTDDGIEGAIFDSESADTDLEQRSELVIDRLAFLSGLAKLWTLTAASLGSAKAAENAALEALDDYRETLRGWYRSASQMRRGLMRLIETISEERLASPDGDHDSMIEYDRRRLIKESMIEHGIATAVEMSEAERFLLAALWVFDENFEGGQTSAANVDRELAATSRLLSAVMRRDTEATSDLCQSMLADLPELQILYVPLSKSGRAVDIALARMRQRIVENLLVALPRLGLLNRTLQVLNAARQMERNLPAGRGAVTQFDELFKVGFSEMVDALVRATSTQAGYLEHDDRDADSVLVHCLEQLTEPALETWLLHSRTLRLSVLEGVRQPAAWKRLVEFIQNYGSDLFTQRFLTLGNIRAILHCGPDRWIAEVAQNGGVELALFDAIENDLLPPEEAASQLNLILEAIVENYDEYRDYNSTTTQSDRGELLYMLLDCIRLRIEYDRVAWNLRPVVWAHEVLVRRGRNAGAQLWRRMLAERIGEEATRYHRRLSRLQKKYAVQMASIAQRIGERFLLPMTIDRMLALVKPAVEQAGQPDSAHAFEILEEETELLMREPVGAGADGSTWLLALEEEVEQVNYSGDLDAWPGNELLIRPIQPSLDDVETQLEQLSRRHQE